MAGPWDDCSPIMPVQHPIDGCLGDFAPDHSLKGSLNFTYNQNASACGLINKLGKELTFLLDSHVATAAAAPVAILGLF